MATWRTGRHVGRTIYIQTGAEATWQDSLIGVMDTVDLATIVVGAVNATARMRALHKRWQSEAACNDVDCCSHCRVPWPCPTITALVGPPGR